MNLSWEDIEKQFEKEGRGNWNSAHLSIDLQAAKNPEKVAYVCVDSELKATEYTYQDTAQKSNQLAHLLKNLEVEKGDKIFVFLPRIIEAIISVFGIIKTGAVAGTLFSGFEEKALLDRLSDSSAKIVITDEQLFGRIEKVWPELPNLKHVIVVGKKPSHENIVSFEEVYQQPTEFSVVESDKEDSAFMLYTSGSTGKPKGIIHAHRALIQQFASFVEVFNPKSQDTYWCTADLGWITGISYILFAPVTFGIPTLYFEGRFSGEAWYAIIQNFKVSILYTAPTALRMLMGSGDNPSDYNFRSLRTIGSVGEPLNPEVIEWGKKVFDTTILDTWFQTELGSISIANKVGQNVKPGSMGKPLQGITAEVVDENGEILPKDQLGNLVIKPNNPSLMKEVWNNKEKFDSYFDKGWYHSGDMAYKDSDGYVFFSGRSDDIINTQGERIGPFEIESALLEHPLVIEAGAIGKPDELRGEIIKAFVVLSHDSEDNEELKEELCHFVKEQLGSPFYPREIEFVKSLPKTRSGKIMRRVLKAQDLGIDPGDLSSLDEQ